MADQLYDGLTKIAEGVQRDIQGDFPDIDTNYDLWIEELRDKKGTRQWFGVIDMGDAYQGVYIWEGRHWMMDHSEGDPPSIINRIVRHRAFQARGR